jgi:hypothetical protein
VKRSLLVAGVVVGAVALVPVADAGQGVGGCQLDGTANFGTGLGATAKNFTYDFAGKLSGCQGTFSDAAGNVSAGQPITIGGVAYRPLDQPTGNGGCSNSDTSGTAFVDWGAGRYSVISYTTKGAAAAVALTGTFKSGSQTLTSVASDPITGAPTTIAVPLAYGGDSAGGPLAFEPPDPTACNTPTGVTQAGIQGVIGHGNSQ